MKRTRMRRQSGKRRAQQAERNMILSVLRSLVGLRCEFCKQVRPLDGHENKKPRSRFWLDMNHIVMLCRPCHERCEWPYSKGRLVIPGTRDTGWAFELRYAQDKLAARAQS